MSTQALWWMILVIYLLGAFGALVVSKCSKSETWVIDKLRDDPLVGTMFWFILLGVGIFCLICGVVDFLAEKIAKLFCPNRE